MKNIIKAITFALLIIASTNHAMETQNVAKTLPSTLSNTAAAAVGNKQAWKEWATTAWNNVAKPVSEWVIQFVAAHPAIATATCTTIGLACIAKATLGARSLNAQIQEKFGRASGLAKEVLKQPDNAVSARVFITELESRYASLLQESESKAPLHTIARALNAEIRRLQRSQSIFALWQTQTTKDNIATMESILAALRKTSEYNNEPDNRGFFSRLFGFGG